MIFENDGLSEFCLKTINDKNNAKSKLSKDLAY